VVRAIEIVGRSLEKFGAPVYVRHEIVHNRHVVEKLERMGAVFVETLDEIPDGAVTIFSAHGVAQSIIDEAKTRGLPTLGLCFGSQILGSALCGHDQVFRRATCEVGYMALDVTPEARQDTLTRDLGRQVDMFVWHNDEVRAAHPDMRILAHSVDCPNHIWRYRDLPIWGIQGHPEVTADQARAWFEDSRKRLEADGADVDALKTQAHDAADAKTMLRNFIAVATTHSWRRDKGEEP